MNLLTIAVRTLEDPTSPPALRAAAVEALCGAVAEGLPLPRDAPMLMWSWAKQTRGHTAWGAVMRLADIDDADVRADALKLAASPHLGNDFLAFLTTLLEGSAHAAHVTYETLMVLVELAQTPEQVRHLPSLLAAVHGARGLPLAFLLAVRDRWAVSVLPGVRCCALTIAEQLPEPDFVFIEGMLRDPAVEVRVAACKVIEGIDGGHEAQRAALVERRLEVEQHPEVRAALHRAMAELEAEESSDKIHPRRHG